MPGVPALKRVVALSKGVGYPPDTIFVSKTATNGFAVGSDSNTVAQAKSRQTPWLTVSKAVASAPVGSLVVINDGSYTGLELGASSYVLFTSAQTLSFKAHRAGQVTFLGSVATAIMRINSSAASSVSTFTGIIFDAAATSDYAILDNTTGGVVHTLNFVNCSFLNTNLHGLTGSATKPIINLTDCTFNSVTRGYMSFTAFASGAQVSILRGSGTITGTNNASPCINLKATASGSAVSITGFTLSVTLASGLTSTGAHDGIVLTNISTVSVTGNTVSLLGHPGSRSGSCVTVTADAAVDVTAPEISNNTLYNETTGGYGVIAGADGSTAGDAHVLNPVVNDNTITAVPANQVTPVHGIIIGFNIGGTALRNTIVGCGLALIQKKNTVTGALFADNTISSPYSIGMYAKGSVGTRFVHNSIYVTDTAHASDAVTVMQALDNDDGTHATGIEFTDNAISIAGNVLTKFVNVQASCTATFANNLYYSAFSLPANPFTYQGTSYASVAAWAAAQEATAVSGDPKFVDAANGNFHLLAGSAAIGAGVAVVDVPTDKGGTAFASPPSIGAYEYTD